MEDTLREMNERAYKMLEKVLILVLMEDTLRDVTTLFNNYNGIGLNPCFNGRYSQRVSFTSLTKKSAVLILVLMEDTLRDFRNYIVELRESLNPCFNGRYSQSYHGYW